MYKVTYNMFADLDFVGFVKTFYMVIFDYFVT